MKKTTNHDHEVPEAALHAHPELAAVGAALAQWRRGEVISARCLKCQRFLRVTLVEATKTLIVACPEGHTHVRAKSG